MPAPVSADLEPARLLAQRRRAGEHQADQIALGVPDEGLRSRRARRRRTPLGVGEDVVRFGDHLDAGRPQLVDRSSQIRRPAGRSSPAVRPPRAAAGCRPGRRTPAVRIGRSAAGPASWCRTRWPDRDRRRAGRPGRRPRLRAACCDRLSVPHRSCCRGRARRRATGARASTETPSNPTAKPSGASMAVRFSQSGRSWDPDANSTMITTMASTPTANRHADPPDAAGEAGDGPPCGGPPGQRGRRGTGAVAATGSARHAVGPRIVAPWSAGSARAPSVPDSACRPVAGVAAAMASSTRSARR